jgi:hypothetical protein
MGFLKMTDAQRIAHVAVFVWQVLVTLAFVAFFMGLVLN